MAAVSLFLSRIRFLFSEFVLYYIVIVQNPAGIRRNQEV